MKKEKETQARAAVTSQTVKVMATVHGKCQAKMEAACVSA
jgi:hypothetical protein